MLTDRLRPDQRAAIVDDLVAERVDAATVRGRFDLSADELRRVLRDAREQLGVVLEFEDTLLYRRAMRLRREALERLETVLRHPHASLETVRKAAGQLLRMNPRPHHLFLAGDELEEAAFEADAECSLRALRAGQSDDDATRGADDAHPYVAADDDDAVTPPAPAAYHSVNPNGDQAMPRLATAFALALAAVAAPSLAGPIDQSAVPNEAKWIVHLDLEAFRASTLGKSILDELATRPQAEHVKKASDVAGFDLQQNLLDATLYGGDFTRESAAILIDVAGGTGNLEGLMLAAPGYQSATVDNRLVHSFIAEDKRRGDAPRMYVSIQPTSAGKDHRLVAAYDSEVLHGALDRLEEANAQPAPTGARNAATAAPAPGTGSILFMLVDDIDPAQLQAGDHSAVLQMIHGLSFDLGETAGRITATAHASVTDEQKAEQLRQLVQGMLAMAQLADRNNPGAAAAAELAQRSKVSKDGAVVSVRLDAAAEEVAARVRELANPQ